MKNTELSQFSLKYGKGFMNVLIPSDNLLGTVNPESLSEISSVEKQIRDVSNHPSGTDAFSKLVTGCKKVVIVISDQTRVLPSAKILPVVISELEAAGVSRERITIVIGAGNHRPPTELETEGLLGELYGYIRCVHSKEDGYKLIDVTMRGTPVEVATPVAEADFLMAIGNVEMHQLASFSGGAKSIAAGTASKRALEHNHRLIKLQESCSVELKDHGPDVEINEVRLDMEEFAQKAGLKFILNTVMNQYGKIVHIAAGDPVLAHRECARVAKSLFNVKIGRKADIVVASAGGEPRDATLYQTQKSMQHALKAVKQNGIVIMAAKCEEGFGDPNFKQWIMEAEKKDDLIEKNRHQFLLGAHKTAYIVRAVQKADIFFVSDMDAEDVRKLYFKPFSNLNDALREALSIKGVGAQVLVMPWAGLTVPV